MTTETIATPRRVGSREQARSLLATLPIDLSESEIHIDCSQVEASAPSFVDEMVKIPLVERDTPDGPVVALVRPEAVSLASRAPESGSGPLTGTVIAITFLGATSRVTVDLGDTRVMAQLPTSEASALAAGSRVVLAIRPDPVLVSAGADPAAAAAGEEA